MLRTRLRSRGGGGAGESVSLTLSGTSLYVRQPYTSSYDIIRKISLGTTPSVSNAGVVDFLGARRCPTSTTFEQTATYFETTGTGDWLANSNDNSPPEKLNGMYLGGGHGVAGSFILTKTGHGLTNADVGDVGTDGAAKSWVLTQIVDANRITVTAANTGVSAAKWRIQGSITGATITFASAGAYAFTASASTQVWPFAKNYTYSVLLDGAAVVADGVYYGRNVEILESYDFPNPADWLSVVIAEKGTSTPKSPSDPTVDTQIEVSFRWRFDRFGAQVGYCTHRVVQEYSRSSGVSGDYFGAQQWQKVYNAPGYTLHQYIPNLTGAVGGYDFTAIADITANGSTVTVMKSDCADTANPASHIAQSVRDGSGDETFGFVHGYARHIGIGVPATRAALTDKVMQLSTSEKQYIMAVDSAAGATAAADEEHEAVTYNCFYDMSVNPTYTVNALVEYEDGIVHWIIDIHDTLTDVDIAIPAQLYGRPATVIDGTNFTLNSAAVTAAGLNVTTTGGYGRAVVRIG